MTMKQRKEKECFQKVKVVVTSITHQSVSIYRKYLNRRQARLQFTILEVFEIVQRWKQASYSEVYSYRLCTACIISGKMALHSCRRSIRHGSCWSHYLEHETEKEIFWLQLSYEMWTWPSWWECFTVRHWLNIFAAQGSCLLWKNFHINNGRFLRNVLQHVSSRLCFSASRRDAPIFQPHWTQLKNCPWQF